MPELSWRAVYADGSCLYQVGPDGAPLGRYVDIDRRHLVRFELIDRADGDRVVARVLMEPGRRLIARRRTWIRQQDGTRYSVWLVGWQELGWRDSQGESNRKSIMYVHEETGLVELAGARGDDDVTLLECEAEDLTGPVDE